MKKLRKIDVCLVTKNNVNTIKGLQYIPLNKLIIERTKPLGLARMRAIQKVSTEWFAFIDDDVLILPKWFESLTKFIDKDIGAIQGIMRTYGFGEDMDKELFLWELKNNKKIESINIGERGFTHNTLIRTVLVRDWKPSRSDLSAFEDYELTQHVLEKGFKWLIIPNFRALHYKTWRELWTGTVWAIKGWKKIGNEKKIGNLRKLTTHPARWIFRTVLLIFSPNISMKVKLYHVYYRIACIYGMFSA